MDERLEKKDIKKGIVIALIVLSISAAFFFISLQLDIDKLFNQGNGQNNSNNSNPNPVAPDPNQTPTDNENNGTDGSISDEKNLLPPHDYENDPSIGESDFNFDRERESGANDPSNPTTPTIRAPGTDETPFLEINECTQNCLEVGETLSDCKIICGEE